MMPAISRTPPRHSRHFHFRPPRRARLRYTLAGYAATPQIIYATLLHCALPLSYFHAMHIAPEHASATCQKAL